LPQTRGFPSDQGRGCRKEEGEGRRGRGREVRRRERRKEEGRRREGRKENFLNYFFILNIKPS
jgi:hypothetical protein